MTIRMHRTILAAGTLALCAALAVPTGAQAKRGKAAPPPAGVYSEAQASRGAALYQDNCVYCHLVDLSGGELAPALTGPSFTAKWTGRPLDALFAYMRVQMPLNSPGGLSAPQNADLIAYLLQKAKYPAGPADLPATREGLAAVTPQAAATPR